VVLVCGCGAWVGWVVGFCVGLLGGGGVWS